jgi:CBS domain-containing protein
MRIDSFMVRDPLTAELWEPLSFVRQKMLTHSFSFLPTRAETGEWRLVSDRALARLLRGCSEAERKRRLSMRLDVAVTNGHLQLDDPVICEPGTDAQSVAETIGDHPVLVVRADQENRLLGIVTAFDLL